MTGRVSFALACLLAGIMLMAASVTGLPSGYWNAPRAGAPQTPHDWSALERNLRPEACAQCHAEQFDAWKDSLHAHAYSSGMVGQFPAMGVQQANDCLRCHAPLQEQLYRDQGDMLASVRHRLTHAEGFDVSGDIDAPAQPLRHAGVSCAVCHVRQWQRFGPPRRGQAAEGHMTGAAHGGFTATRDFEQSQFCASCHQFPASMAINGKPLENTLTEWKSSVFAKKGVTCQQCHMPERRHEFRGIHDADMVKKGLQIGVVWEHGKAVLSIRSQWIGHAFPTYVTPKIMVQAEACDGAGNTLQQWQWEIVREVAYRDGWQELRDTRLMPGETRRYEVSGWPRHTASIRFTIRVEPDAFYKGVYESLLADRPDALAAQHLSRALERAEGNDYLLFERLLKVE